MTERIIQLRIYSITEWVTLMMGIILFVTSI